MSTVLVTNNKYPDNPVAFVVDFMQVVKKKGEPNTDFYLSNRGEHYWEAVIYTDGVDSEGNFLGPYWIDELTTEGTLNEAINNKIKEVSKLIDWSMSPSSGREFEESLDVYGPIVYYQYPLDGQIDVPINSNIVIRLKDLPPAVGIDISTLVFKVDGFNIVPDIYGDPFDYVLSYRPKFSK